ncbi:MAG: 16S rRNA (guanine(966)-N(2))-methyltransferase RsmD [Alphaproteobacteria bacterium]|nr:16S rRNA (guanine(966)-N(2))-methyltransferase RsmD [Alphaproteobacteria bacterium]
MRIVAGRHRGRPLEAPAGDAIRPTGARVREAVFDILAHGAPAGHVMLPGASVLDAFAGTGAMGLEALSRGAARAAFIEKDRAAVATLRANVARLGEDARAHVLQGDATRPPPAPAPADLVFLDPPYAEGVAAQALSALAAAGWLAPGAVAVVETAARDGFTPPEGFREIDRRRYGKAAVSFLVRS